MPECAASVCLCQYKKGNLLHPVNSYRFFNLRGSKCFTNFKYCSLFGGSLVDICLRLLKGFIPLSHLEATIPQFCLGNLPTQHTQLILSSRRRLHLRSEACGLGSSNQHIHPPPVHSDWPRCEHRARVWPGRVNETQV